MPYFPSHFSISNKEHELQEVIVGGRRWIIASLVGRAVGLGEAKSFAKSLIKKPALRHWGDSMVANEIGFNREEQLFAIQRRILSANLTAFAIAHMRLSETQVSVFRMVMTLCSVGYDLSIDEMPMEEFSLISEMQGILISKCKPSTKG